MPELPSQLHIHPTYGAHKGREILLGPIRKVVTPYSAVRSRCVELPPLTRGKGTGVRSAGNSRRITPAYAGKSGTLWERRAVWRDHPRCRGEYTNSYLHIGSPPLPRRKLRAPTAIVGEVHRLSHRDTSIISAAPPKRNFHFHGNFRVIFLDNPRRDCYNACNFTNEMQRRNYVLLPIV